MKTNYAEGNIFRSKKQRSFRVICGGRESVSFFEAYKIDAKGCLIDELKNYNKEVFELEIQPTKKQKLIKESIGATAKLLLGIAADMQNMKEYDVICSLGASISLLEIQLRKLENKKS